MLGMWVDGCTRERKCDVKEQGFVAQRRKNGVGRR
jgi:hypothetical protein